MDHNDRIDNIIRVRVQRLASPMRIRPSEKFVERTMVRIRAVQRRQQFLRDCSVLLIALSPVFLREAWTLLRGDYVSLARLPLGRVLVGGYQFFMSELGVSVLLIAGTTIFIAYLLRFRRPLPATVRTA